MSLNKRITNTDSRFYILNPSYRTFLDEQYQNTDNLKNLIKDEYFT